MTAGTERVLGSIAVACGSEYFTSRQFANASREAAGVGFGVATGKRGRHFADDFLDTSGMLPGGGGPWHERIRSLILLRPEPVHVLSSPNLAAEALLESLESIDRPLIRVDLGRIGAEESEIAAQFVDAVNAATRSQLLQFGPSLGEHLAVFERFVQLLGPFLVAAVSPSEIPNRLVRQFLALNRFGSRVVLISPHALDETGEPILRIDSEVLALQPHEADWIADGRLAPQQVGALMHEVEGNFSMFVERLNAVAGVDRRPTASAEPSILDAAREFGLEPLTVVTAAMKRKRYIEAFRIACERLPSAVPAIIDDCGEAFFARGMFGKFWILLSRLPEALSTNEAVLRWTYATAMAVNRHADVIPLVEAFLSAHEAPELRAQYAASRPGRDFLQETSRAVNALQSPITLRHHAFALSFSGRLQEAIETFRRALRLAELLGRDQLVVAIATDTASAMQRNGEFQEALWWAEWATTEYVNRGLNENYRRQCALAAMAFGKLLTGEVIGLSEILQELRVSEASLGVPSYEGVASTVADALFVGGQLERALQLYEGVYSSNPFDQVASASVDYVKCLCEVGRGSEALQVAARARALSRGASDYEQSCALLALGIAQRSVGDPSAQETLKAAAEALDREGDVIRSLQARLNLMLVAGSGVAVPSAAEILGPVLSKGVALGESGWTLLGGHDKALITARETLAVVRDGLDVRLLGEPYVSLDGVKVDVSDRQLDLLALLASPHGGLTLQEVAVRVYGDRAVMGTTKALISRLRDILPIDSRPYRLGVRHRADFLELMEHLKHGRVRQALNLYKGPLLPESEAPAVIELREHIDESLRQAVLASGDAEAMVELANRTDADDLELLEAAFEHVPRNDPQSPLLRARIRQVRRDWGADPDGEEDVKPPSRNRRSSER